MTPNKQENKPRTAAEQKKFARKVWIIGALIIIIVISLVSLMVYADFKANFIDGKYVTPEIQSYNKIADAIKDLGLKIDNLTEVVENK